MDKFTTFIIKEEEKVKFESLEDYTTFKHDNSYYVKIPRVKDLDSNAVYNALEIGTYTSVLKFEDEKMCVPVNLEVSEFRR